MIQVKVITKPSAFAKGMLGYYLQTEGVRGKGFYEAREFSDEGEADIAKGLLELIYTDTLDYSEWDFILRAMLRLAHSNSNQN